MAIVTFNNRFVGVVALVLVVIQVPMLKFRFLFDCFN